MPSKKVLEEKKAIVETISNDLKNSLATVLVDSRGLTVEEDTILRTELRKQGVAFKVRKNTLTLKAADQLGIQGIEKYLNGPTTIATCTESYTAAAKILIDYSKKYKNLTIKAGIVDEKVVDSEGVNGLADLPSKEVLISKVLGGFNAPISGLVTVLNGNIRGLVCALQAIADKKNAEQN